MICNALKQSLEKYLTNSLGFVKIRQIENFKSYFFMIQIHLIIENSLYNFVTT